MIVRLNLLAHIVVLIFDHSRRRALTVLYIDEVHALLHNSLLALELLAVVVTDDVGDVSLLDRSVEPDDMEEPFVPFGIFRSLLDRQQSVQFRRYQNGVLHLALGVARMHIPSLNMYLRRSRVEILELQLSDLAAIHRVGIFSPELLDIELNDSASDLLVWREPDLDLTVLELRMLHDVLHRVHNLRHTGLVVRAKQRGSVRGDQRLTHVVKHLRELRRLQRQARHTF